MDVLITLCLSIVYSWGTQGFISVDYCEKTLLWHCGRLKDLLSVPYSRRISSRYITVVWSLSAVHNLTNGGADRVEQKCCRLWRAITVIRKDVVRAWLSNEAEGIRERGIFLVFTGLAKERNWKRGESGDWWVLLSALIFDHFSRCCRGAWKTGNKQKFLFDPGVNLHIKDANKQKELMTWQLCIDV